MFRNGVLERDQISLQYRVITGKYLGLRQALGWRVDDINGRMRENSSEREDLCILYFPYFPGEREVLGQV